MFPRIMAKSQSLRPRSGVKVGREAGASTGRRDMTPMAKQRLWWSISALFLVLLLAGPGRRPALAQKQPASAEGSSVSWKAPREGQAGDYAGAETCVACDATEAAQFGETVHARTEVRDTRYGTGCECPGKAPAVLVPATARAQAGKPTSAQRVYVTNFDADFISVIDIATNRRLTNIHTGRNPHGVAVSPDGTRVYVSNEGENNISVVDGASDRVIATVPVGSHPNQLCVSQDGRSVYVTNNAESTVSVIETATNRVTATITVGRNPHIAVAAPDGKRIFVTSEGDNKISIVDHATKQVVGEILVFGFPRVMVVSPDSRWIYLTLRWLNGMVAIDADRRQVMRALDLGLPIFPTFEGKAAHGLGIAPDGKYVYVTSQILNTVNVINAATFEVVRSIPVGMDPNWIDFTSGGRYAYVSNTASNDVSVIDTGAGKVIATIPVGQHPKRLAVGPVSRSGTTSGSRPAAVVLPAGPAALAGLLLHNGVH